MKIMPVLVLLLIAVTSQANAALLIDYSPDTTGAVLGQVFFSNREEGQHFADLATFNRSVSITGLSIFSGAWAARS